MCRKFFPPAAEGEEITPEEEADASAAPKTDQEDTGDGEKTPTLDLPDAPKDEPKLQGQPDAKKAKRDDVS